jgi:hypothetical protein
MGGLDVVFSQAPLVTALPSVVEERIFTQNLELGNMSLNIIIQCSVDDLRYH